jgi:hypothetical protein
MSIDMRYQMLCGLDGDWRLRSEPLRILTGVYRSRPEIHPAPTEVVAPAVSVLTMGEARHPERLSLRRSLATQPMRWVKRIMTPHKLRKSESKPIAARGTL